MNTFAYSVCSLALAAVLAGCGGGGGTAPGSSSTPAGSAAPAADAKKGDMEIKIAKYGLVGKAPGETEAPIIGDGDPALIMASQFTVTLSEAKPTDPKTIKDAEEAAKLFNPKNSKSEKIADGWVLTYENTGSAGANYFVNTRREIGGKAYLCDTMQTTPEQQKKALEFCKSLTKG
jgi:hypothetical protein